MQIASMEEIIAVLETRCRDTVGKLLGEAQITKSNCLETALGAVVTFCEAVKLMREQEAKRKHDREKSRIKSFRF